jgi:NhaA family Na+:H+ antiporter
MALIMVTITLIFNFAHFSPRSSEDEAMATSKAAAGKTRSAWLRRAARSERASAALLLLSAAAGLIVANSAVGASVIAGSHTVIGPLTAGHWVSDALLAVFFFVVAAELKLELTSGQLNSARKAMVPAIAALGGVAVPAAVFILIAAEPELARGWPIPTATDIAFALGVIAVFGRGLPSRMRVFLLALAVLDDLIGIVLIATILTRDVDLAALAAAAVVALAIALASRHRQRAPTVAAVVIVLLAITMWVLVHHSGVHATVAGVALGLVMTVDHGGDWAHRLQPASSLFILPLFAFSAALVVIPETSAMGPVLLALAIALPLGKLIGITAGATLGAALWRRHTDTPVLGWDLVAVASVGGIGFTVALLMNQLAFADLAPVRDQGVLGVLIGSGVSLVAGAALVSWRARVHRRGPAAAEGQCQPLDRD